MSRFVKKKVCHGLSVSSETALSLSAMLVLVCTALGFGAMLWLRDEERDEWVDEYEDENEEENSDWPSPPNIS